MNERTPTPHQRSTINDREEIQLRLAMMKSRIDGFYATELAYDRTVLAISGGGLALLIALYGECTDVDGSVLLTLYLLLASLGFSLVKYYCESIAYREILKIGFWETNKINPPSDSMIMRCRRWAKGASLAFLVAGIASLMKILHGG